jgi:quercetin dioxygenase-like cupin family protein
MEVSREHRSRPLTEFGSEGATITFLGADARLVRFDLEPGGRIARHPAAADQVLVVVDGEATVSGGDDAPVDVGPGDVVRWAAGEEHETVARTRVVALVVEDVA